MIDQGTPFRTGDAAYARAAPGGFASLAAVPTDPAFSGNDDAYTCPSLGGDFVPGSGMAAPTSSPVAKGSDADGGAADIAAIERIDEPEEEAPETPAALSVTASGNTLIFAGQAAGAKTADVLYQVNDDAVDRHVAAIAIPDGTSAGAAAAIVAGRVNGAAHTTASVTSNAVHVGTKTPNTLDSVSCTIA